MVTTEAPPTARHRVVIAGGHGQIARHLEALLVARGDTVVGLVRNPAHADELISAGAEAVVIDLESSQADALAPHLDGATAVVFAAGAGPGSSIERKQTVDRDAAVLLADAAAAAGVRRYMMVSAMGADEPLDDSDEVFAAYLSAKAAADRYVRESGLDWTIVRPGGLTNEDASGTVEVAERVERGSIPRADVAAVLAAVLDEPHTIGRQFELVSGETAIAEALRSV